MEESTYSLASTFMKYERSSDKTRAYKDFEELYHSCAHTVNAPKSITEAGRSLLLRLFAQLVPPSFWVVDTAVTFKNLGAFYHSVISEFSFSSIAGSLPACLFQSSISCMLFLIDMKKCVPLFKAFFKCPLPIYLSWEHKNPYS